MKVALVFLAGVFLFCICQVTAESDSLKKVIGDRVHEIVKRQSRRRFRGRNRYYDYDSYDLDDRYDDRYDDDRFGDDRYDDNYSDDRDYGRFNRFNRRNRRRRF